MASREATDGFIAKVLDGGQRGRLARLGPVRNASEIEDRLGISLRGYGRGLNADDVAHTMRRHGNDPAPITRSDLANYYGWANTQRIDTAYSASTRGKPATLTYAFTAEGHAYRVTETINPRTRLITLKTMRKTPA